MRLDSDRIIMVDCDDTLVLWDLSEYSKQDQVQVSCYNEVTNLVPHTKNINLVEKFYKLGYTIVVWSQSGSEWAEAVGNATGIDEMVMLYMSKPRYYMDDLPCTAWMGERLYREPIKSYPEKTDKEELLALVQADVLVLRQTLLRERAEFREKMSSASPSNSGCGVCVSPGPPDHTPPTA